MKLINPTDDQLNAAFAEKVCRWTHGRDMQMTNPPKPLGSVWLDKNRHFVCIDQDLPSFVSSLDMSLPYLADYSVIIERVLEWKFQWQAQVSDDDHCYLGRATTPAKALVIALLQAHGVETPDLDRP